MKSVKDMLVGLALILLALCIHLIAEHGFFWTDFIFIPVGLMLVVYDYIQKE